MLFLFIILNYACSNSKKDYEFKEKSISLIGKTEYSKIYQLLNDTLQIWKLNRVFGSIDSSYSIVYSDSLLCFNEEGNRFISCLLNKYVNKKEISTSDEIFYFYGEKINNNWFFFSGASIVIPRSMIKNQPINTPLSYQQLHQIALKEVYSGYLKRNGEINEDWFKHHFEGPGWVNWDDTDEKIKKYTTKDYEQFHLKVIRNNWNGINKDSIKQLPPKNLP